MKMTAAQRFFRMLAPNKKELTELYIFAIISGLIALSIPLGIQSIINLIQGGEVSASWILLIVIVIFGYLFSGILQILQLRIVENLQKDIFARSAFEFTFRIPRIKMHELFNQYAPELMNRFFDTISVQKGLSKILVDFSTATLQIIFGLILLSFYHPFFIIFSFLVIVLVFLIGRYIFHRGLKSSYTESKYKYKVAFWLEEVARTHNTFRLSCDNEFPLHKTDKLVNSYLNAREDHFKILVRQYYLFMFFKIAVAAGFLFMGGMLVINEQMNIGQFVAAEIIVLLLIASSEKLLLSLEAVYDLLTSIEKIGQVMDFELEKTEGFADASLTPKAGLKVDIQDIYFSYPEAQKHILNGVNLQIEPGENVLLSGGGGSGKTTLLRLMTALYDPQLGSIRYDDIPVQNYKIDYLRQMIAECISEDAIFDGTLLENLTLGRKIPLDEVHEVCLAIGLDSFINEQKEGYEVHLGPSGKKAPKSVAEKITIVRNLLKKPRLFLVEDFFGDMTADEKKKIFEYITSPDKKYSLLVVSNDPKLEKYFDKRYEIIEGRI